MPKDKKQGKKPRKLKIEGPEDPDPQAAGTAADAATTGPDDQAEPQQSLDPTTTGTEAERTEQPPEAEDWRAKYEAEHDRHLRAVAELQNLRKRFGRERAEMLQYANERLLLQLLEVVDNFELAMEAVKEAKDAAAVGQGVQMILEQLRGIVADFGVTAIETAGQKFDPHWHEAVERVETQEAAEGEILEELKKGYKLHDRLLRPARVKVAIPPRSE